MTSQTTLIVSLKAADGTCECRRRVMPHIYDAQWSRSGIGVAGKPSRVGSFLPLGRRRLQLPRASGSVSTFRGLRIEAVDSHRRAKERICDPAMSKNRFDASFILEIVESSKSHEELNYEHTNVHPLRLYRIYSVLPVVYVVLSERRERRRRRVITVLMHILYMETVYYVDIYFFHRAWPRALL
ncbi:hypothetical protein EVAR_87698_1 [Eumeta japonica]|uniref:Uncharacterized protein n=1 Tax=Eumeta variegata TaxID=151549 RepID=A0A4C2A904_EUMVA|nr:hypothetical protein EVAR_87698_1 [Eumeta japonica]